LKSPSGEDVYSDGFEPKENSMKYFGTVKSFDAAKGMGTIKPETANEELSFERSAISWGNENPPTAGQRLSYDIETKDRQARAVNLQTI
jgi:cold shock CspA family protein